MLQLRLNCRFDKVASPRRRRLNSPRTQHNLKAYAIEPSSPTVFVASFGIPILLRSKKSQLILRIVHEARARTRTNFNYLVTKWLNHICAFNIGYVEMWRIIPYGLPGDLPRLAGIAGKERCKQMQLTPVSEEGDGFMPTKRIFISSGTFLMYSSWKCIAYSKGFGILLTLTCLSFS